MIGVLGSLWTENFKDKEGNTRYKTYVLVNNIEFLGTKKETTEQPTQEVRQQEADPFTSFGEQIDLNDDFLD